MVLRVLWLLRNSRSTRWRPVGATAASVSVFSRSVCSVDSHVDLNVYNLYSQNVTTKWGKKELYLYDQSFYKKNNYIDINNIHNFVYLCSQSLYSDVLYIETECMTYMENKEFFYVIWKHIYIKQRLLYWFLCLCKSKLAGKNIIINTSEITRVIFYNFSRYINKQTRTLFSKYY